MPQRSSTPDPVAAFSPEAWQDAYDAARGRSRVTVRWMTPDEFLGAALIGFDTGKDSRASRLVAEGTAFTSIPFLKVESTEDPSVVKVYGHEGRHRTMALRAAGVPYVPVQIIHITRRWSEDTSPEPEWMIPEEYAGHWGRDRVPFPGPDRLTQAPEEESSLGPVPAYPSGGATERCPCSKTDDPAAWLRDDHNEISEMIERVNTLLRTKDLEGARTQFLILSAELDVHFRTEEDSVFSRLSEARHLDAAGQRELARLRAQHPGFRRDLARVGRAAGLAGFAALGQALEAHAVAENKLLLPAGGRAGAVHPRGTERVEALVVDPVARLYRELQAAGKNEAAARRACLEMDPWGFNTWAARQIAAGEDEGLPEDAEWRQNLEGKNYGYTPDFSEVSDARINEFWETDFAASGGAGCIFTAAVGKPKLLRDQWLAHFTNDADAIQRNGFSRGTTDWGQLALTYHHRGREHRTSGYNFAFALNNLNQAVERYNNADRDIIPESKLRYGDEVVLFRSSGIKFHHGGDNEDQVMFWGPAARDLVVIKSGSVRTWDKKYKEWSEDSGWYVDRWRSVRRSKGSRAEDPVFHAPDLETVIDWVTKNYAQYADVIGHTPHVTGDAYARGVPKQRRAAAVERMASGRLQAPVPTVSERHQFDQMAEQIQDYVLANLIVYHKGAPQDSAHRVKAVVAHAQSLGWHVLGAGATRIVVAVPGGALKIAWMPQKRDNPNGDEARTWELVPDSVRAHLVPVLALAKDGYSWLLMERVTPAGKGQKLSAEVARALGACGVTDIRAARNLSADGRVLDYGFVLHRGTLLPACEQAKATTRSARDRVARSGGPTPIGFWRGPGADAKLPDPSKLVGRYPSAAAKATVVRHLENAPTVANYRGMSWCRICGKSNGASEQSDGVYLWPSGLAHYVRDHNVVLDAAFLHHVGAGAGSSRTGSKPPSVPGHKPVKPSVGVVVVPRGKR